jgi:hypothetical protein
VRYRDMRFDADFRPFVAPQCVYVLPLCPDPSRFRVLVPAGLEKRLLDLLIQNKLLIRHFQECPPQTVEGIREQLRRGCRRQTSSYSRRMNGLIAGAAAFFLLGIVNWIFPDPLPLADELLMIGAGAAIGLSALMSRSRNLPLLREKSDLAVRRLESVGCRVDALLTRIHQAIRDIGAPAQDPGELDPIELESRWLVEHLDLQDLLDAGSLPIDELKSLLAVLSNAFPLSRFLALEQKLRRDPRNRRTRRARGRTARSYGLCAGALTVYAEFFRLARQIVSSGGRG